MRGIRRHMRCIPVTAEALATSDNIPMQLGERKKDTKRVSRSQANSITEVNCITCFFSLIIQ